MKKLCARILTLMMVFSLCVPAGAAETVSSDANDITILPFETAEGYKSIYTATHEWVSGGYANSDGALQISQGSNNLSGLAIDNIHTSAGVTYDISIMVKPPEDNVTALDGAHIIIYHYWEDEEGTVSSSPSAYNEFGLGTKEDMGDGWYKLSTRFTVPETCNLWTGTMQYVTKSGTAGQLEFRGQVADVTYMVDDFICVPSAIAEADASSGETPYLLSEDFENGQGEIVMGDGATTLTVEPAGGVDNSAYLACESTNDYGGVKKSNLTIEPNRVYKLSWWAKADNEAALGQYLTGYFMFSGFGNTPGSIQVRDNGKIILRDSTGEYGALTNEWTYYEAYYKSANLPYVAADSITGYFCTRIFPALTGAHGGNGANFSLDNMKIEKMPVPFNGDFAKDASMQAEWNSPVTYYPVWVTGSNTTAANAAGENPYVTVTQAANSAAAEDTATRIFRQYVPRKAAATYKLSFRAKSDSAQTLTPVYTTFSSASEEVEQDLETVALTESWTDYEMSFTTDETVSNAILGFTAEKGANTEQVSYDIDDISLVEQKPIMDAVPLTGDVVSGGSITAGAIPRISGTTVLYRVLCSPDDVQYATVAHGILDGNTVTYALTDDDAGRYTKMEFVGIKSGTVTNKITTEPVFFGGSFLDFTSGIYDKEYAAQGKILDAELADSSVSVLIAMYGENDELLDVHQNTQPVSTLTNGRISVSGAKAFGTVKAKAFLWEADTFAPLTRPKEITQMERNPDLAVNIAADGIQAAVVSNTTKTEEEYMELADAYVASYLKGAPVGKMLFNVCYKRAITDSDVVDSVLYNVELNDDGTPKKDANGNSVKTVSQAATETSMLNNFRAMMERDIDVIEMLVSSTKEYGAEAWLSVRMNDHHFPNDIGFNSSLSYNRASEVGVNGSKTYMDHTNEIVQNYYKGYIRELCENYDIDGIEFDYLRSAPVMSAVNDASIEELNSYFRELRATVNEVAAQKGKEIKISARVYSTPDHNLSSGIDPAQWIADGSIDMLVAEGWYIPTYYNIPIEAWRETIDARNTEGNEYKLLGGTDWAVRCDSTANSGYMMWITLEQLKGFASVMYARGADGIYFFNHFSPNGASGALTYYVDENGVKTSKNILNDKLLAADSQEAAEQGMRAYVNTCRDYSNTLYPISVADSTGYTVDVNTGTKPTKGYYSVVIGIDDNEGYEENLLAVTVNGASTTQLGDVPAAVGFTWAESASAEPVASHVSETAPRVMQFVVDDLSVIQNGVNTISITNTETGRPQSIKWLEVRVDNTEGAAPVVKK